MTQPLKGRTVALAESRQLEELVQLLEKEGATVLRYPLVNILDAPDGGAVLAWIRELISGGFAYVVLMTGEALRRLLDVADRAGLREAFLAALAQTKLVTRGPKPVKALKEHGLAPYRIADAPTTEGVITTLRRETLLGLVVGYTLFGDRNPALETFLQETGAEGRPVLSYVYGPASDADRVADLIDRLGASAVDLLMFTSSPQVDRLFEVAKERGLETVLVAGLEKARVAAVGPIVAESLHTHGVRVDIQPEQGWVMKNLVQYARRAFEEGKLPS